MRQVALDTPNNAPARAPSFTRALVFNVVGLVIFLELVLLAAMAMQSINSTDNTARTQVQEKLDRVSERLTILIRAAEMTGESAERAAQLADVSSITLRSTIEHALAAFEQRPELSFLGIVLAKSGEYGTLERSADGNIFLWMFPGVATGNQVTRRFRLTPDGFLADIKMVGYDYDPRTRPFYQAAISSPTGQAWMSTYRWIVHDKPQEQLWGFSYVKTLHDKSGELVGVLDSDFDLPALNRFLKMLEAEYDTHIQVVELGDTQRLIGGQQIGQIPLEVPAYVQPLIANSTSAAEKIVVDGQQQWVASMTVSLKGGPRWLIVTTAPTGFIEIGLLRQLYQVGAMGLIIAIGLVLVSIRLARRFGQPLAELEGRLETIGISEFHTSTTLATAHSGDFRETFLLGRALDNMKGVVSELIETKEQQAESLRLKSIIFDSTNTAIISLNDQLRIIEWNTAAQRVFGALRDSIVGEDVREIISLADPALHWSSLLNFIGTGIVQFIGVQGQFDAEFRVAAFKIGGQDVHTIFINDISERKQAEERIRHLATHDGLTGLPNRNLIMDRIVQAIKHARRANSSLALLYLDLDRFKVINDGFGHSFGDTVLQVAAKRLTALVREGDTVSRQGGDEFLILLTDLHHAADAYIAAEKVVKSLDRPIVVENRKVYLTGSIGVSVYPHDGETPDELIDNADVAMYRAKELGRNTYQFFTPEMSEQTQRRVTLETYLREAIAEDQFTLAYQPKVDLITGCIVGCEALLRWHHPQLGPVSPDQFIPIAEDSGLIVPIGDWVLRTACAQAKAWAQTYPQALCVAVNISARQFLQQDVTSWVVRTLEETGLRPDQLELEFTESLIAKDVNKVITTFNQLRQLGVKLSIDDFGTGYSSLSYLKRFRVDALKIDQSFVRDMLTDPEDAAIVRAVISMAHSLEFKVIAEGVETLEHSQFLRQNACNEIQGFYISKPLPAEEFAQLLV